MGTTSAIGEIVEVSGGHIVRSTGRKDRHSKVYTAKGPRDRRVRLAAHTAIQFYDVQDRLGYDRPSKAVDWLIKKAKSAIEKLTELPPCYDTINGGHEVVNLDENRDNSNSGFVPPPMSSVSLTESMKTFFPTSSGTFPPDILSRTANPIEDLGLSLHTFRDRNHSPETNQNLFSGSPQLGYEPSYQRMAAWGNDSGEEHGGGFVFSSLPIFGHGGSAQSLQTGHLQSSYQSSLFGTRFVSDGLHGYCIPGQIPTDEDSGMLSERLSSSPMDSGR